MRDIGPFSTQVLIPPALSEIACSASTVVASTAPSKGSIIARAIRRGRPPAEVQPLAPDNGVFRTSVVAGQDFLKLEPLWRQLAARAIHANVFLEPAVVAAVAATLADPLHVLLVWEDDALVGVWALVGSAACGGLLRVLKGPVHDHMPLSTPVIDQGKVPAVLLAMFEAIAVEPRLPKLIELVHLDHSDVFSASLKATLSKRRSLSHVRNSRQRPELSLRDPQMSAPLLLSRDRRKGLARRQRRLGELGKLDVARLVQPADVEESFETFLAMERSGWKGRRVGGGRALLLDVGSAAASRAVVRALADRGLCEMICLRLDERPIAMQLLLRSGATCFTWKTTHDERLREYSPGLLLLKVVSEQAMEDASMASIDSCNNRDDGYMAEFWSGRKPLVDTLIDVRPGLHLRFVLLVSARVVASAARAKVRPLLRATRRAFNGMIKSADAHSR